MNYLRIPREERVPTPYQVMRIDDVPETILLSEVLAKVSPYCCNILGIQRVADYASRRLGTTLYVYVITEGSAEDLGSLELDYANDDIPRALYRVDSLPGRAAIMNSLDHDRYPNIPMSLMLRELQKLELHESKTNYLILLLGYFESRGAVTGIRLNYDPKRLSTLTNGFITYLNNREARELADTEVVKRHVIYKHEVTAIISHNVPMLVDPVRNYVWHNGIGVWSREAEKANQLIIDHPHPFVHPRCDVASHLATRTLAGTTVTIRNADINTKQGVRTSQCEPSTSTGVVASIIKDSEIARNPYDGAYSTFKHSSDKRPADSPNIPQIAHATSSTSYKPFGITKLSFKTNTIRAANDKRAQLSDRQKELTSKFWTAIDPCAMKFRLSGKKLVNILDVKVIQSKWPEPIPDDVIVIDDYSDISDED